MEFGGGIGHHAVLADDDVEVVTLTVPFRPQVDPDLARPGQVTPTLLGVEVDTLAFVSQPGNDHVLPERPNLMRPPVAGPVDHGRSGALDVSCLEELEEPRGLDEHFLLRGSFAEDAGFVHRTANAFA